MIVFYSLILSIGFLHIPYYEIVNLRKLFVDFKKQIKKLLWV